MNREESHYVRVCVCVCVCVSSNCRSEIENDRKLLDKKILIEG